MGNKNRLALRTLAPLMRQWADLAAGHIALSDCCLHVATHHRCPVVRRVFFSISQQLQQGTALSEACAKWPVTFSAWQRALLHAGEQCGRLPQALDAIARALDAQWRIQHEIQQACYYPAAILGIACAVGLGIGCFILPQLASLFAHHDYPLPLLTRTALATGAWLQTHGLSSTLLVLCAIVGQGTAYRTLHSWRDRCDTLLWSLPCLGRLLQTACLSRNFYTLGLALQTGVPIISALDLTIESSTHPQMARAWMHIRHRIALGHSLSQSLAHSGMFPPECLPYLQVAEQTGQLEHSCLQLATQYERQLADTARTTVRLAEPLALLVLAIWVGALVLALYQPIFYAGYFL